MGGQSPNPFQAFMALGFIRCIGFDGLVLGSHGFSSMGFRL